VGRRQISETKNIHIVPEKDIHLLRLNFPTPSVVDQYKAAVSLNNEVIIINR